MLTRIQLNLLGRRTYLSSVIALASPPPPMEDSRISLENRDDDNYENMYGNDFETNRKYLTFSWWLLHRGSKQIMDRVMAVVKDVFGGVNIREDASFERLAELVMQVRTRIEGSTEEERRQTKWLEYLLPAREDESFVIRQSFSEGEESASPQAKTVDDPMTASAVEFEAVSDSLRRLLDETSDLIDSPTFTHVLTRLLDASFSQLIDYRIASEAFKSTGPNAPGSSHDDTRITEITDATCKIANILPIFCKQAHAITAGNGEIDAITGAAAQQPLGNEYLAAIDSVHDLNAFAAVIYSSNFEYEVIESNNTSLPRSGEGRESPESQPTVAGAAEKLASVVESSSAPLDKASESGVPPSSTENDTNGGGFEAAWKKAVAEDDR